MSSYHPPSSTQLNTAIQLPNSPSVIHPPSSTHTLTSYDTDILMSQSFPIFQSPPVHHEHALQVSSQLQVILENMQSMQAQFRSFSDRVERLEQATTSRSPVVDSVRINIDSRPSSSQSLRADHPADALSEHFLRVEVEYYRLQLQTANRSPLNYNNNIPVQYPNHSLPSNILQSTSIPSPSSPFSPTYSSLDPHSSAGCQHSSSFQPITQSLSPTLQTVPPPALYKPHALSSFAVLNNPPTISLTLPSAIPPLTAPPTQLMINSNDATPSLPKPLVPSLFTPLPTSTSLPSFTMTLNNNLPTFKGLANERPIQFLPDFEIRASALVGAHDSVLLHTLQPVLSDDALPWFGQLQKSQDHVTTWAAFKLRFSERYHTPGKVQNLRTELRLLFQSDNESTLDYFERVKPLMVEIDPECSPTWLTHKFVQKLRSDIRTRLNIDTNLSILEIIRKAQEIKLNIKQQEVDETLKLAAIQELNNIPSIIINNLSMITTSRRRSYTFNSKRKKYHQDLSPFLVFSSTPRIFF